MIATPSAANVAALGFTPRDLARFLAKIDMSSTCWTWMGGNNGVGYGQFHWGGRAGKRTHYAHRLAYELWIGPIPEGMTIDHVCDRGANGCVTPDHLRAIPFLVNVMRSSRNILIKKAQQTHCIHGHPLDGENLYRTANGRRGCVTCMKQWAAASHAATRAELWRTRGYDEPPPKRTRWKRPD